jgi:hypothetical protein
MRKLILIFICLLSVDLLNAQTDTTNFGEYPVGNVPNDPTHFDSWDKTFNNSILASFGNIDSTHYKGFRYLTLSTQNTWRGTVCWNYKLPHDTLDKTLTPKVYSEFAFYQGFVMKTSYGYVFRNDVPLDSTTKIRGFGLDVVDMTSGTDSIRIIKFVNNVGIVKVKAALSFTFKDIYNNGVSTSIYCLKGEIVSDTIKGKVWKRGDAEPSAWNISYYDTSGHNILSRTPVELSNIGWSVNIDYLSVDTSIPPPVSLYIKKLRIRRSN